MPMTKIWEVLVSPERFHNGVENSMGLAEEQICTAVPVNGPVVRKATPDGKWVFVVPSQVATKEGGLNSTSSQNRRAWAMADVAMRITSPRPFRS